MRARKRNSSRKIGSISSEETPENLLVLMKLGRVFIQMKP